MRRLDEKAMYIRSTAHCSRVVPIQAANAVLADVPGLHKLGLLFKCVHDGLLGGFLGEFDCKLNASRMQCSCFIRLNEIPSLMSAGCRAALGKAPAEIATSFLREMLCED